MMEQRERHSVHEKVDVCDLILNVADDIKEQFLPLYTYDIDMWYLITMMIIVAIIIICITIGMFYTSKKSMENATLVTIKRERVVNFTGVNIPLEKIIIKKVHSNGTVESMETWNDDKDKDLITIYEEVISGYEGKDNKTVKSRV